ncbi:MAG: hypothetical protein ACRDX8_04010 [Acidimicrobiales bacterium]
MSTAAIPNPGPQAGSQVPEGALDPMEVQDLAQVLGALADWLDHACPETTSDLIEYLEPRGWDMPEVALPVYLADIVARLVRLVGSDQ